MSTQPEPANKLDWLLSLGWELCDTDAIDEWLCDPVSRKEYPMWRALEIARRDQGRGDA